MKIKEIVSKMSLKEKASLMSGKNFWETQEIEKYGIPSMFLADGPHGVRRQEAAADHLGLNESLKATCFPPAVSLANTWNEALVKNVGKALGKEALVQKVNVLLGPGTNIKRNPLCGRNFEYYSEDPYLSGKIAAGLISGVQDNGISACAKHFAVNNQEERRMVIDAVVDQRAFREIYLTPFEIAVKQGKVSTIMSSYNRINGTYANENELLLNQILREQWKFKGMVVTDWGGNNDRVLALKAGNDLEMPGNNGETDEDIIKAIENGELDEKYLDEAVERVLNIVFKTSESINKNKENFDIEKHHNIAYQAAQEAVVLLKNDGILPISGAKKVAIIGDFAKTPRYQGAGSSIVNPTKLDSTLDVIAGYDFEFVGYERGFKRYGKKSKGLVKKALKLANNADFVLLYIGLDEISEAEGMDRKDMKLPENQLILIDELVKLDVPVIAVLSTGAQIELPFTSKVSALIHGHLLGQAGARAVLDVVTGKVNPSGKLSESIPFKYEDVSTSTYFPGKEMTVEHRESIYVGYRYFEKAKLKTQYPFGYGLSYTKFEYKNLEVTDKGVSFELTNVGDVAGSEVVQLYVGKEENGVFRPIKELKGFKKVSLKPKQTAKVKIDFDEYTFRYWDLETNQFEVEKGNYQIYLNSSLHDNKLKGELHLEGTIEKPKNKKKQLPTYYSGNIKEVKAEEFRDLLGYEIPNPHFEFIKKKRIVVGYNTTVAELRYARGWTGRFFAWAIRVAPRLLSFFGQKQLANTIYMGMHHQPMRGISRMTNGALSWGQLDGLLLMFNGKFFKGLKKFFKEGKVKKLRNKRIKKEKADESN